jgi:multidrug efflux pump subunit AcrB
MIDWMARNGVAANLLMVLIIVGGLFSAATIVQEVFPEFSLDAVQVRVEYPGGSPEEIEQSIVQRIEDRIEGIEGIDRITATAAENFGIVTAELTRSASESEVREDIKQEVDRIVAFPEEAEEPTVQELTNRRQVLQIALYGDATERSLKEAAKRVKDGLASNPSISLVEIDGVRDYEISVEVSRDALRAYDLTLPQVASLVRQGSLDLPGGEIKTDEEQITIRTEGQNYTKTDFENIVLLAQDDGTKVRLGDVATVDDGFEDSELITRFNGERAALLKVFRTGDEQVLTIVDEVKAYLDAEVRPSLPAGMQASIWQNQAENLRSRLNLLIENGLLGLFLVIVALGLFLNPRLAFWTSVGIFLSFIGTFAVMIFLDVSVNLISLFGFILSIGIVVDDAIVVGENVFAEQEAGTPPLTAAIKGAQRVAVPVIFAVLTTVAAFTPLLFVAGTLGKFLGDIPTIVITVLLLSIVEVLFILPFHLSEVKKDDGESDNAFVRRLNQARQWVADRLAAFIEGPLERGLHFATRSYGITICIGVAGLFLMVGLVAGGYVRASFFPEVEGELVTAQLEMPVGTAAEQTARVTRALEETGRQTARELQAGLPEDHPDIVRNLFTSVGRQPQANSGPDQSGSNLIQARVAEVSFELIDPGRREVSASEFEQAWRENTGALSNVRSLSFTASVVQAGAPVSVELAAENPEQLGAAVSALEDSLRQYTGVFDIRNDQQEGRTELELALKPAARTLGLTLEDVASQVRAAFFGAPSYRLQRGQDEVRVFARLPDDERDAIGDLDQYRISGPTGAKIPLEEVATVREGAAPSQINRRDGRRVVTVTADVNEEVVTGQEVVSSLGATVLPNMQEAFPQLDYTFQGQQRQQREAQESLLIGFSLALFAIYALLAIPFRSYLQPIVIMSTIPFGWFGAILGHLLFDIPLGLLSIFGIVGLSGVIVNDALVMIDFANEARAKGDDWATALVKAGKARFRPILLTSLTTFLGVFPIIIETSVQAQFLVPLAVSLGFGIIFGTGVLMLIVPALAMLQRDAVAWIQTRLLGYDTPSFSAGPYETRTAEG